MTDTQATGLYAYHVLKASVDMFGRQPNALDADDLIRAQQRAAQIHALEDKVLNTEIGQRVSVPDQALDQAVAHIRARYESESEFETALQESGVTVSDLRRALWRELAFDAVLNAVVENVPPVTDQEVERFFEENPEKFHRPELRTARHILITINDDYADNTKPEALKRIQAIADYLQNHPNDFANQAMQHSECPTALEGGLLGNVPPAKLYAELDQALFALNEGDFAGPIETEAGFHMVLCEKIQGTEDVSLDAVRDKLRQHLFEKRKTTHQKAWIQGLEPKSP